VAAKVDGGWLTPPLDAGLLPGIGRAVAIEEGRLREAPITVDELLAADEVALVSDNRGWRRATVLPVSPPVAPSVRPAPRPSGT
jgi:para-aminobenzoate synthetase/4-amino-4-deoxychorismate lyase